MSNRVYLCSCGACARLIAAKRRKERIGIGILTLFYVIGFVALFQP